MTFNTIEDVNGTQFDNQGFWWHCIDTSKISTTSDFTDTKYDFCRISRKTINEDSYKYEYTIKIDNPLFAHGHFELSLEGLYIDSLSSQQTGDFKVWVENYPAIKIYLYMGHLQVDTYVRKVVFQLVDNTMFLNLKEINNSVPVRYVNVISNSMGTKYCDLIEGYNLITGTGGAIYGYVLAKLLKTNFQFNCNQDLTIGKVNTVSLGTETDYKPNGALVGEYTTKLSVLYNDKTIPVVWNESVNDYTFDLDLTNIQSEGKIRFKVIVEANEVLNASETDVALDCKFETIDTLAKLENLFKIGGTGRLSSDLTLTNDLTLSKNVNLIGNDCSIDMASHKLVIPSDLTFKAQSVGFNNGVNTLQQEPNSTVELNNCSFTDCTGFGSVIDCQVDLASLDETDDFNTKLTNCTISNCDMAILHGGNLEVNGCSVIGKISNKNYPYFLYQTDGNATILNSEFNLTDTTVYDYDIEFNSCIFTCGETATINGYSHIELQQNNRSAFLETQRNTSTIDVQYYYSLIEANVHLQSSKGFCHSVSGIDFVYKTNITLTRGE